MTFCGFIAIIGRPNVGKSTLLNRILQEKVSITSRKPQTTRHRILGIKTEADCQWIYVDTPGIHRTMQHTINRVMNKTAYSALKEVDVILFMVDANKWNSDDDLVLKAIKQVNKPCILVLNKVDLVKDKSLLLPQINALQEEYTFKDIIPISAKSGVQIDKLEQTIKPFLPQGPFLFADDQFTDKSIRFLCAEIVREKIFRFCGQELPYSTSVEIESFKEEDNIDRIHVIIWVDKPNHKPMIIGDKGQKLKEIATQARMDMERLLDKKVMLKCWCKVKRGWLDDERLIHQFGYYDRD